MQKLLGTVTVGVGGAASIDFSAIPASFTDLLLVMSVRSAFNNAYDTVNLRLNGSSANASEISVQGNGQGSANSGTSTNSMENLEPAATAPANLFGNSQIYITNYALAQSKCVSAESIAEASSGAAYFRATAGIWVNNAAVTSLSVYSTSGALFVNGSTASLYGIN